MNLDRMMYWNFLDKRKEEDVGIIEPRQNDVLKLDLKGDTPRELAKLNLDRMMYWNHISIDNTSGVVSDWT